MALADSVFRGIRRKLLLLVSMIHLLNPERPYGPGQRQKEGCLCFCKAGVGWANGFCMSVLILSSLLRFITGISSCSLGLPVFAIISMVIREERKFLKSRYSIVSPQEFWWYFCITYFNPPAARDQCIGEHLILGLVVYVFLQP